MARPWVVVRFLPHCHARLAKIEIMQINCKKDCPCSSRLRCSLLTHALELLWLRRKLRASSQITSWWSSASFKPLTEFSLIFKVLQIKKKKLFGSFQRTISGSNETSEKVVLCFRREYFRQKFVFHFFKATFDTSFRPSQSFSYKWNWFVQMVNTIPGRNLPVLNFAYHLTKPWSDWFAHREW